jgi:hypothetical protein
MNDPAITQPFFQVGVLVENLEAAQQELSDALGITWSQTVERRNGDWTLRACFSQQGPPYIELIEGPAGSPWEPVNGSRIDHIGYWAEDLKATKESFADAGLPIEHDGTGSGAVFTYHRGRNSGLRVEFLDASGRAAFHDRWGLEDRG